jgi:hypothetical protein
MTQRITRASTIVCSLFVVFARCMQASTAAAHAAPAYPPEWEPGPCVTVVDKDVQPIVRFGYRVPIDDTQLTVGDIALPDALTHQFFAFNGSVSFEGFMPELRTFDAAEPNAVVLPLWISRRDVERAQMSSDTDMLGYDLSTVGAQNVLETEDAMRGRWLRITGDDHRVPITSDQSLSGLQWDTSAVDPGLYTVAGYIFSPPYNGWEIRSGLVAIVDRDRHTPAAVLSRVQESLFAGQGRKVRTCLYAPEGTRMRASMMFQENVDAGWTAWGEEMPVESGTLEQCFHPPAGMTGTIRLRVELIAPDGSELAFYSPDTMSVIAGSLPCTESDSICCEAAAASSDAVTRMNAQAGADASVPEDGGAAESDAAAAAEHEHHAGRGCNLLSAGAERRANAFVGIVVALLVLLTRKRTRVVR